MPIELGHIVAVFQQLYAIHVVDSSRVGSTIQADGGERIHRYVPLI